MLEQRPVDFGQSFQNRRIGRDMFAQAHERPHDEDTHLDCPLAVENVGSHHGTVFGKCPGTDTAFPPWELVTICDRFG